MAALLREAHDLDELATAYRHFLQRWDATHAPVDDALAGRILMAVEWMRLKTSDPHLPLVYVPEKWPALEATAFLERRLRETGDQTAQQARGRIVLLH